MREDGVEVVALMLFALHHAVSGVLRGDAADLSRARRLTRLTFAAGLTAFGVFFLPLVRSAPLESLGWLSEYVADYTSLHLGVWGATALAHAASLGVSFASLLILAAARVVEVRARAGSQPARGQELVPPRRRRLASASDRTQRTTHVRAWRLRQRPTPRTKRSRRRRNTRQGSKRGSRAGEVRDAVVLSAGLEPARKPRASERTNTRPQPLTDRESCEMEREGPRGGTI
jgi:CelD/BcsL family acetyltransferase involved in cellulose biosynthesis